MIIPASNVYASLGLSTEVIVSTGNLDASFEIGQAEATNYVTGVAISDQGFFMSWMENPFPLEKFLGFSFTPIGTPTTPNAPVVVFNTTSPNQFIPAIFLFAEDGGQVDIVINFEDVNDNDSIGHFRSTNNGGTFSSLNLAVNGTTTEQTGGGDADPIFADVKGNTISSIYALSENQSPFNRPINVVTSSNGGTSFTSPVQLGTDPNFFAQNFVLHIDTNNNAIIHTAWSNSTNSPSELFYSRSVDSGVSFSTPIILSSGDGIDTSGEPQTLIHSNGNDVTIVFHSEVATVEQFSIVRSNNNGATWNTQEDVFLGSTCNWDRGEDDTDPVAFDGSTIQVVCSGAGGVDMFTARSENMGSTWTSLTSIMSNALSDPLDNFDEEWSVKVQGNSIYVATMGNDIGGGTQGGTFFQTFLVSHDKGVTFTGETSDRFANVGQDNHNVQVLGSDVWLALDQPTGTSEVGFKYASILIPDLIAPVITPKLGKEPIILQLGQAFSISTDVQCIDDVDGTISFGANFGSDNGVTVDPDSAGLQTQRYFCKDSNLNNVVTSIDFLVKRPPSGGSGGDGRITGGQQSIGSLADSPAPSPAPTTDVGRALSLFDQLNSLFDFDRPAEEVAPPTAPTTPAPTPEADQRESFIDRLRDFFSSLFG